MTKKGGKTMTHGQADELGRRLQAIGFGSWAEEGPDGWIVFVGNYGDNNRAIQFVADEGGKITAYVPE